MLIWPWWIPNALIISKMYLCMTDSFNRYYASSRDTYHISLITHEEQSAQNYNALSLGSILTFWHIYSSHKSLYASHSSIHQFDNSGVHAKSHSNVILKQWSSGDLNMLSTHTIKFNLIIGVGNHKNNATNTKTEANIFLKFLIFWFFFFFFLFILGNNTWPQGLTKCNGRFNATKGVSVI